MTVPLFGRSISEVVSTFCLIIFGCGAIAVNSRTDALTHVGVATVWGLVVMVMIFAVGRVSGCHMNPAVTIAFTAQGRLPVLDAVVYIVSQCVGALLGAAAIRWVLGLDDSMLGSTTVQLDLPLTVGLAIEFMLTAVLMFVVMCVSTGAREESVTAAIAVGATIAMEAFVCGPLTNASMNPARSLGPAVVAGDVSELWLYIVGPIAGALFGALVYRIMVRGGIVEEPHV